MHESSIVASLLQQVSQLAQDRQPAQVSEIALEVGLLSGVEPCLLREAFERLKFGSVAANSQLLIEAIGLELHCRECDVDHRLQELNFSCPQCGSPDVRIVGGDAVTLVSVTLG